MMRIFFNILLSIAIVAAGWWFQAFLIPFLLLAVLWTGWYFRRNIQKEWEVFRNQSKKTASVLSGVLAGGTGLLAGILIYRFVFEVISVPSPSMEGAIEAGDYIIVNKLVPGPRRHPHNIEQYFRMQGIHQLQRGDIILFNFPEGDTILENRPDESYYYLKRHYNNFNRLREIRKWGRLIPLDVKERPRFVKRLVALPGDTLQITNSEIFINGEHANLTNSIIKKYQWLDTKAEFNDIAEKENILNHYEEKGNIVAEMSAHTYNKLPEDAKIKFRPTLLEKNIPDRHTFPFNRDKGWNTDFLGPVVLPGKGTTVNLNHQNIDIYKRAIRVYEQNQLEIRKDSIIVNGEATDQYQFKMNYYWVMGDNRPHSFDSRFWGFLPENHVIGKIPDYFLNLEDP
ncbi:MAG: signal peptidase I [Marinilabiliaceae bacterium]